MGFMLKEKQVMQSAKKIVTCVYPPQNIAPYLVPFVRMFINPQELFSTFIVSLKFQRDISQLPASTAIAKYAADAGHSHVHSWV